MWQSRDHARIWCKTATCLLIPQRRIFERNLFYKIDAEASYLAYISVKIHLPLSCELGNQICALYSEHALYKLWGRGRTPLSWCHFIPEAISPWRVVIKQEQSRPLKHTVESKLFVIFLPQVLLHTVRILNIFTADSGCDSRPL
jgi:hypothetical protein